MSLSLSIVALHGSHVAWQEQKILFPMGKEVLSYAKHFHCSCHAKPLYSNSWNSSQISPGSELTHLPGEGGELFFRQSLMTIPTPVNMSGSRRDRLAMEGTYQRQTFLI